MTISIYSLAVKSRAERDGITELQAYRILNTEIQQQENIRKIKRQEQLQRRM